MQPLTLYLTRHGESVSNFNNVFIGRSEDPELTEKGIRQANSLANSLKGKPIAAIFSSTLKRARQTARIVADTAGTPIIYSDDLIEVGLGLLDGHDIGDQAFLSVYENMVANWEKGYPQACIAEGESLLDLKERVDRFFNKHILPVKWNAPVILVGHAILWMGFIWSFCENRPSRIHEGFMSKTNLSVISKNGKGYMLTQSNLDHDEITGLQ